MKACGVGSYVFRFGAVGLGFVIRDKKGRRLGLGVLREGSLGGSSQGNRKTGFGGAGMGARIRD